MWGNREEANRQAQRYYPSGAPRYRSMGGTQSSVGSGQLPPSTSPTADEVDSAPTTKSTPPDLPEDDKPAG